MKYFLSLLLCIAIMLSCLSGCKNQEAPESSSVPASSQAPEETSEPDTDWAASYEAAAEALSAADALSLTLAVTDSREVGQDTYTQVSRMDGWLQGLSAELRAHFAGTVTMNEDEEAFQYEEQFLDGTVYASLDDSLFQEKTDAESYLSRHYPASLIDPENYEKVTGVTTGSETVYTFTGALGLEDWVQAPEAEAAEIQASAVVTDGTITSMEYEAHYTQGAAQVSLQVSSQIHEDPEHDFPAAPEEPDAYFKVSDWRLPVLYARAVSNLLSPEHHTYSASISQVVSSQAAGGVLTSSVRQLSSDLDAFMADLDSSIHILFTGDEEDIEYTINEHFEDGVYTYTMDGESTSDPGILPDQVRISNKYYLGRYVLPPYWLSSAGAKEVDGGLLLTFSSKDEECGEYLKSLTCNELFGDTNPLDDAATDYASKNISGWMGVDLDTMLPVSYSLSYGGIHTIEEVTYPLSQEFTMSVRLSDPDTALLISEEYPQSEAQAPTPLFYHVTGDKGEEMWLLGTIHAGDERIARMPQTVLDALDRADSLAVECDIDRETTPQEDALLAAQFTYAAGDSIGQHLDSALLADAENWMKFYGQYSSVSPMLKPSFWENALTNAFLSRSRMLSPEYGVDRLLLKRAKEAQKEILELESLEFQAGLLGGFSDAIQEEGLASALEDGFRSYSQGVRKLYDLWCAGDEEALLEALREDVPTEPGELELYNEYNKAMTLDRNQAMTEKALGFLQSGSKVFVAVGLAHVIGEAGLAEGLRNAGYKVEIIPAV